MSRSRPCRLAERSSPREDSFSGSQRSSWSLSPAEPDPPGSVRFQAEVPEWFVAFANRLFEAGFGRPLLEGIALRGVAGDAVKDRADQLGLVEAGLGVAAVPSLAMPGRDHPLLVGIPLHEPEVTRHVGLIRRRGRLLSPAAQQLYDFFGETARSAAAGRRDNGAARKPRTAALARDRP